MGRLSLLLLIVAACGKKPTGATSPLPPDKPNEQFVPEDKGTAGKQTQPPATKPAGPLEAIIPTAQTTVKLLAPGKGKREKLAISAKPGTKQQIEMALDLSLKQSAGTQSAEDIVPTMVLAGEAEAKTADASGFQYALVITKTDARETTGAKVPLDKFRSALASLVGMKIDGSVAPNGLAGDVKLHVDAQTPDTLAAFQLLRVTFPSWPVFPTEPIGAGAKWQVSSQLTLANGLVVDRVTEYQLVSHKNATWTIKGTTKVSGKDQETGPEGQRATVSKIAGDGTSEVTLADGALYPSYTSKVNTTFTASAGGPQTVDFSIRTGAAVTAAAATTP